MQANQRGAFYKSLSIMRNEENFSKTVLKSELLKKTENYTVLVQEFVTNITPPLNGSTEVAFEILRLGTPVQGPDDVDFPAYWPTEEVGGVDVFTDARFTPTPIFSTIEFLRQAQQFFHKFGFIVRTIGVDGTGNDGTLDAAGRAQGFPFLKHNYVGVNDRGWHTLADQGRMVTCKIKSDGVFQIEMQPDFAANFYIRVGETHQRLLGFDEIISAGEVFAAGGNFAAIPAVPNPISRDAQNALHSLDERLSIDVWATIPISTKIFSLDGAEEHEHLLVRFPINDYNRFDTVLESTPEAITGVVVVREDVNVGLEDLTRKSPSSSALFMLPGTVQEINIRLFTRYFRDGKIVLTPTVMKDGFWSLKLLFGKKV